MTQQSPTVTQNTFTFLKGQDAVRIGVIDDSFDIDHDLLRHAFDMDASRDHVDGDASDMRAPDGYHGTPVVGRIVADDGAGGIDASNPDAEIVAHRIAYGRTRSIDKFEDAMRDQAGVDVSNNSWGFLDRFSDNFDRSALSGLSEAMRQAAETGRDGLGTSLVFSAGNKGYEGDNVNYHNMQNSEFGITVGAVDSNGWAAWYSTPGSAVLVSAEGVNVSSTDRSGSGGYGSGDITTVDGTSFAAPAVSGLVSRMYEVNAELGYRDVQEILAYSSKQSEVQTWDWETTGATDWNGGGLTFNNLFGFGIIDEHAALRLAESWSGQATYETRETATVSRSPNGSVTAAPGGQDRDYASLTFDVSEEIDIDRVKVDLDIDHGHRGDLVVKLISPGGTESVLIDRPGKGPFGSETGSSANGIDFETSSVKHFGESSLGTWEVRVENWGDRSTARVNEVSLEFVGDIDDGDDTYIFTDAFADLDGEDRGRIEDTTGQDTLSLAAVTGDSRIDLGEGSAMIAGRGLTFASDGSITEVRAGDGADSLEGGTRDDALHGGRGADNLSGSAGDDILAGGRDDDTLDGGLGEDIAAFAGTLAAYAVSVVDQTTLSVEAVSETLSDWGTDLVTGIEWLDFGGSLVSADDWLAPEDTTQQDEPAQDDGSSGGAVDDTVSGDTDTGSQTDDGGGASDSSDDGTSDDGTSDDGTSDDGTSDDGTSDDGTSDDGTSDDGTSDDGTSDDDTSDNDAASDDGSTGSGSASSPPAWESLPVMDPYVRDGTPIDGTSGAERMEGSIWADRYHGGDGDDALFGHIGDDSLYGEGGADTIEGGGGHDRFFGGAGDDVLTGGSDGDVFRLQPGHGVDTITDLDFGEGDAIEVWHLLGRKKTLVTSLDDLLSANAAHGGTAEDTPDGLLVTFSDGTGLTLQGHTMPDTISGSWSPKNWIEGKNKDDRWGGTDGDDYIRSSSDGQWIKSGNGDDVLSGGGGDDLLVGMAGEDLVIGGSGDDFVAGITGNDTLTGNEGADTFLFRAGDGQDVFTDVSFEEGDIVRTRFLHDDDNSYANFHSLDHLIRASEEAGYGVSENADGLVVDFGGGDSILVMGQDETDLLG